LARWALIRRRAFHLVCAVTGKSLNCPRCGAQFWEHQLKSSAQAAGFIAMQFAEQRILIRHLRRQPLGFENCLSGSIKE
jgi:hypothetical protein